MDYRRKSTRGEIVTVVTIGGLLVMGIATLVTSFLVKNKNIKLTSQSKASGCTNVGQVIDPGQLNPGADFTCSATLLDNPGSRTMACGWSKNGGWPQTGGRWVNPTCVGLNCSFGIKMEGPIDASATYELVVFDTSAGCGPTGQGSKRITLHLAGAAPPPTDVPNCDPKCCGKSDNYMYSNYLGEACDTNVGRWVILEGVCRGGKETEKAGCKTCDSCNTSGKRNNPASLLRNECTPGGCTAPTSSVYVPKSGGSTATNVQSPTQSVTVTPSGSVTVDQSVTCDYQVYSEDNAYKNNVKFYGNEWYCENGHIANVCSNQGFSSTECDPLGSSAPNNGYCFNEDCRTSKCSFSVNGRIVSYDEGEFSCNNGTLSKCINGQLRPIVDCGNEKENKICDKDAGTCISPGGCRTTVDVDGYKTDINLSEGGWVCDTSESTRICKNGQMSESIGCNPLNGSPPAGSPCTDDKKCKKQPCGSLNEGQFTCDKAGNILQRCIAGQLKGVVKCGDEGKTCVANSENKTASCQGPSCKIGAFIKGSGSDPKNLVIYLSKANPTANDSPLEDPSNSSSFTSTKYYPEGSYTLIVKADNYENQTFPFDIKPTQGNKICEVGPFTLTNPIKTCGGQSEELCPDGSCQSDLIPMEWNGKTICAGACLMNVGICAFSTGNLLGERVPYWCAGPINKCYEWAEEMIGVFNYGAICEYTYQCLDDAETCLKIGAQKGYRSCTAYPFNGATNNYWCCWNRINN